ncbi:MAG TPA: hypothetical protein VFM28_09450 [Nitrososphaeraceae archaeon]|jgi:hypothetical protein|nr:hypothetical protein [Nitrososphaeraceae archaeon]
MIKDRQSNLNVLVISVFLISAATILALHTQLSTTAFAQDNNWYVGEGVTKDMYVKYTISHFDTNNGREFSMMIYFKEQDDKGNWIAPVYVEDQGKVLNGTFILSPLDLTALGTSQIPPEMGKYRSAYANSLQWLAAYVPKPGLSLSAGSWGKIGAIGGSEIKPVGHTELNIPAFPEPIDTTRVEYYKSVSSNMYILNEFPYPVMAKTYVDVTTGSPPIQFQYILTETGKGEPETPLATVLEVMPPLKQRTERGDFYIQLDWDPTTIRAGEETTFTIDILDKDQFPTTQASYNLMISDSNNTSLLDLKNQLAREGTKSHTITFEQPGVVNVKVKVNSVKGVESGLFIEEVEFQVPVK